MVKKAGLMLVAFLSVAAVLGFVVSRPFGGSQGSGGGGADAMRAPSDVGVVETEGAGGTVAGASSYAADEAAPLEVPGTAVSELPGLPPLGQAVVKTADISVEVRKGTFAQAFDEASLVAGTYGGYVEASSISGAQASSGSLLVRVPAARFDEAMSDLRGLGTVTGESISGQVVTQDFIDLEARLRTWETQEAVLLGLMEQADSIDSTLRIQRELQDVQFRIEQIKGELRVLEDRTSLSTIRLSMVETGAPITTQNDTNDTRPSLAEAWGKAVDGLLGVAYAMIVGLGYLVPITALGLLAWFGYRRLARRVQPQAPSAAV
ncbi:MAG: DUF4349 domain-containing protein [Actinomycetota bacterium]